MNAGVRNIRVKKKVQSLALISSLRFFQVLFHHGSELDTEYPRCFPTSGVYMWSNRYPPIDDILLDSLRGAQLMSLSVSPIARFDQFICMS